MKVNKRVDLCHVHNGYLKTIMNNTKFLFIQNNFSTTATATATASASATTPTPTPTPTNIY
jgi:hypothetical protein